MKIPQFLLHTKTIALTLLLFGYVWIILTDFLAADILTNVFAFLNLQLYKGFLFITIASVGLYMLLHIRDKRLDEHQRYTNAILETITVGILVIHEDGTINSVNNRLLRIMGYKKKELIGKPFTTLIEDENKTRARQYFEELRTGNSLPTNEWKTHNKDGRPINVLLHTNPLHYNNRRFFIISATDITHQKNTQVQLEQALNEQQVLLSEVHHRVKNNLAIISGLMQLQLYEEENPALQEKLKASVSRIQAIGSIHELLYQSHNLSKLQFDKCIHVLINHVTDTYPQSENIDLILDLDPVIININQGVPVCLIINELVSNALQHAFREEQHGVIHIELSNTQGDEVKLAISDNGIGLPDDFHNFSEFASMGFNLVDSLLTQLEASHQISSTNDGTSFSMRFSKENIKGSSSTFVH